MFINSWCRREKVRYALLMRANKPETAVQSSAPFFSWHHMVFSSCFHDDAYCLTKPQAIFFKTTSPLLKLADCSTHGGETWYVCLLYHFHDDYMFPWRPHIVWKSLGQFSLKLLLHSSDLLTVTRMEVKLGAHVYYIVSMTTITRNSLRQYTLKLLLHSSNLLTAAHREMMLGTHAYYIISMTTTSIFHYYLFL